ncbi:Protein kinase [Aphelenchoides besseyi]|nr:Protein kinase [Aphelenchoides besseyi]
MCPVVRQYLQTREPEIRIKIHIGNYDAYLSVVGPSFHLVFGDCKIRFNLVAGINRTVFVTFVIDNSPTILGMSIRIVVFLVLLVNLPQSEGYISHGFYNFLKLRFGKKYANDVARYDYGPLGSFVLGVASIHWGLECHYVNATRTMIKAVAEFTNSTVNVIAYSMGGPISRKAILGGKCVDTQEDLGPPLTHLVDVYLGVGGANNGALGCLTMMRQSRKTANKKPSVHEDEMKTSIVSSHPFGFHILRFQVKQNTKTKPAGGRSNSRESARRASTPAVKRKETGGLTNRFLWRPEIAVPVAENRPKTDKNTTVHSAGDVRAAFINDYCKRGVRVLMREYADVMCHDENRVILRNRAADDNYIHASYVRANPKAQTYICTQGPMDETAIDFWQMVVQEKAAVVVMLCNFHEKGEEKCCNYYPLIKGETNIFGKFKVCNSQNGPTGIDTITWSELHVDADLQSRNPMAGQLLFTVLQESDVRLIKELRGQRLHAIQSAPQYIFIHVSLMELVVEKLVSSVLVHVLIGCDFLCSRIPILEAMGSDDSSNSKTKKKDNDNDDGTKMKPVYKVHDQADKNKEYALKVEKKRSKRKHSKLKMEVAILKLVGQERSADVSHFTACIDRGKKEKYFFLVMELVGQSLDDLKRERPGRVFSIGTGIGVSIQCLEAVEDLHKHGFIHRDIKPANYACGINYKRHIASCSGLIVELTCVFQIYLLDFGIARKYLNENNQLKTPRKEVGFKGTVRFASINCHKNLELGPKDDVESWFYLVLDMIVTSGLPWKKYAAAADCGVNCDAAYDWEVEVQVRRGKSHILSTAKKSTNT